jgi:hypothetical protein
MTVALFSEDYLTLMNPAHKPGSHCGSAFWCEHKKRAHYAASSHASCLEPCEAARHVPGELKPPSYHTPDEMLHHSK